MSHRSSTSRCARREFMKRAAGTAAAALGLGGCGSGGSSPVSPTSDSAAATARGPRVRVPNPFVNGDGAPILVSVEGRDFAAMLEEGLRVLGGLQNLVSGNAGVLINPNFNMAEPYPGISRASSVADLVRETRAVTSGSITVADEGFDPSPQVYTYLNLYDIVQAAGGVVESFSSSYGVRRGEWSADKPDFRVYSLAHDAPIIISLCNVKRHMWASYSCAIKNNVGIVAGAGGSATREYLHDQSSDFMGDLAEIAGLVNPELFVVDAMSVLTENGPSVSQGVPVPANRLILCGDMAATDAYCTRLLAAHDPGYSAAFAQPLLQRAAQLGLGQPDLSQVDVREITL
jgi:uncharacterized protein (DUF362 family)